MMEAHLFVRAEPPTPAELAEALAKTQKHWDNIIARALELSPTIVQEWKRYGNSTGWVLLLKGKKNNVLYMRPMDKSFMANMALGEVAYNAALECGLPPKIHDALAISKKYPEGWPARVAVRTGADAKAVMSLLALKLEAS
jgi:hypothetical protein